MVVTGAAIVPVGVDEFLFVSIFVSSANMINEALLLIMPEPKEPHCVARCLSQS